MTLAGWVIETIVRWAAPNPGILEVWLFGSCATGVLTSCSDIDLALVLKDGDALGLSL